METMEEAINNAVLPTSFEEVVYDKTTEVKVTTPSDYAQVLFSGIAKTYPVDAHIECKYTITTSLVPSKWDWVGLYKVGWTSPKDKVHYEWAVIPAGYERGKEVECSILFHSYNLPRDDGEFYQFCYINSSGQMRGASVPFQFRHPGADELVECEDEDFDLTVINTKANVLLETVQRLEDEREQLVKKQEAMDADRNGILTKLVETTALLAKENESKDQLSLKVKNYEATIDQLNAEAKDMGVAHDVLQEKIDTLSKEKEKLQGTLDEAEQRVSELEGELRSLRNTVDESSGRVQMLEEEKELFKNHFTTSEEKIVAFQTEIENLKKRATTDEKLTADQKQQLASLEGELKKERKSRERLTSLHDADKETIQSLTERYQNSQDQLTAMEDCKAMLNDQLKALQDSHDQMSNTMEKAKTEAHSLKVRLAKAEEKHKKEMETLHADSKQLQEKNEQLEKTKDQLAIQLSELKLATVDCEKTQQGSLYAMREAYNSLKSQHADLKKRYNVVKTEVKELRKLSQRRGASHEMKRENEDMRERLEMAKDEYVTLYHRHRRTQLELEQTRRRQSGVAKVSEVKQGSAPAASASQCSGSTAKGVSVDVAVENLTSEELQTQLDEVAVELEERRAKNRKYKKLYQDECEKNRLLQAHYQQEYAQFKEKLEAAQAGTDATKKKCERSEVIMEQPRYANPYTVSKDSTALPPIIQYPHSEGQSSVPPVKNRFPNPYLCSGVSSKEDTSPEEAPPSCSDQCFLEAEEPATVLEEPLKPLPAPMQPQVLPSAKLAAVKHAVGLGRSSSESSVENEDLTAQALETKAIARRPQSETPVEPTQASAPPMEEAEEDRFHDAVGEPQRTCPVCSMAFSPDYGDKRYQAHVTNHFVYTCPMCDKEFDKEKMTEEEFEEHVQKHLSYS